MGASTGIGLISSGTVIPIVLPIIHDIELSSPNCLEMAKLRKVASRANHARRCSKRKNVRASAPLLLAYLGSANGASFDVARPRERRTISSPAATVSKKPGFSLSGAALGSILAASLVVLWLFFLLFYLKHRRRRRRRSNVSDVENRDLLQASYDSSSRGSFSVIHSIDSPQFNSKLSSPAPPLSQQRPLPPSKAVTPISLPPPSGPQMPDKSVRKARLERPARPPPLVLRRERSNGEARQGDPFTTARSRSIKLAEGSQRESILPNPWDSGAKPSPAAFELVFFGLPSFSAPAPSPIRPANSFRAGLPRSPRATRTFPSHEVRSLKVARPARDRTTFEPRRRL